MQVRQGDVFLEPIDELPIGLKEQRGRIILAEGEVTGHCHEIKERKSVSAFVSEDGVLYLDVCEPSELTHQEHSTIVVAPGKYRVVRQREYSPVEIRRVQD
jgi:hypothetical protein